MDPFCIAKRSNKRQRLSEKGHIFDTEISKKTGRPQTKTESIRVVLPAEQMKAIAKSRLERQGKRKAFSIPMAKGLR